ncbi:MAG: carotenoid biosynthesis protein [Cyclobacteriaceae bacterium]
MQILSKNILLPAIVLVLHIVGAVGTISADYNELFLALTPLNLVLTTAIILIGYKGDIKKIAFGFISCTLLGFSIEVIGVITGWPFGEYTYGETLGLQLLNVPLVIGLNWFLLTYCFYLITLLFRIHFLIKSCLASLGMVLLDHLIEPVAISLDYWSWSSGNIPFSNFVAWFVISLGLQLILHKIKLKGPKVLALMIVLSQFLYFCVVFAIKV